MSASVNCALTGGASCTVRNLRLLALLLTLTVWGGFALGTAHAACEDPASNCTYHCDLAHSTELVCQDKCLIKAACKGSQSFDIVSCNQTCQSKCQKTQAKLVVHGCAPCDQSQQNEACS